MRFAFRNADDRAETAADETPHERERAHADAGLTPADAANGALDPADTFTLYDEYLSELDKVPTLRDPVLPETSGQHQNLEEKIREIVREELAKMSGETPTRSSSRSRKRRKR